MSSIRLRLLKRLIGPVLLVNLAGGALTWTLAWLPARVAFDQGLADAAVALAARLETAPDGWRLDLPRRAEAALRGDDADAVYFAVRDGAGRLLAGDADFPAAPAAVDPAGASIAANAAPAPAPAPAPGIAIPAPVSRRAVLASDGALRGQPVRIAALAVTRDGRQAWVGVARTLRQRDQLRLAVLRGLLLLETLLTLASAGLVWLSVSNGLLPLNRMRANLADLAGSGGDQLAPISPAGVPDELQPVVSAFNGLLNRVDAGARARQDFLANVAHQLRTPLAGLRTQLEWLAPRHVDSETVHAIGLMLASTERISRQTNQLLALARAEPGHFDQARLEPLALEALVEPAIQQFVEQSAAKHIDLGFELDAAPVMGDSFLLRDLIDNLVDNALRYTPAGGTVTVACRMAAGQALLTVEDNGPGIAPEQRDQVFSRHVRLDKHQAGSGLGLAIVRDIALAHGATVTLDTATGGRGALFAVRFPALPARSGD